MYSCPSSSSEISPASSVGYVYASAEGGVRKQDTRHPSSGFGGYPGGTPINRDFMPCWPRTSQTWGSLTVRLVAMDSPSYVLSLRFRMP